MRKTPGLTRRDVLTTTLGAAAFTLATRSAAPQEPPLAATPNTCARLLPRVRRQLLRYTRADGGAGRLRADEPGRVDGRDALVDLQRGRRAAARDLVPRRGTGCGGDDAQRPHQGGPRRRDARLRAERRGAAARAGVSGAPAAARHRGERER